MNILDYIIIIIMVFLLVKSLFRGFIREIASLAGIILGVVGAYIFLPEMINFLKSYIPSTQFLPFISFAIIFAIILIFSNLLGWGMQKLLKKAFLGWFDKGLGIALAMIKGVVIIYIALVLLTFFLPKKAPLIAGSVLAPWIVSSYQSMSKLISPDFYEKCKQKISGEIKKLDDIKSDKIKGIIKSNG